ncbi:MAG: carboxypeptidase-like regulatory domain-containing protein, partial [Planctomycetota bacterium]
DVTVHLPPKRTISGRVFGPDGQGVAGARIKAFPVRGEGKLSGPPHGRSRTGAQGAFTVGGLWDGEYRLYVKPPLDFLAVECPVVPAGTTGMELALDPGLSVMVTVLDPAGGPVPGASVWNKDAGIDEVTGSDGTAVVRGLMPDVKVPLVIRPPEARDTLLPKLLRGWEPADTTVRLEGGLYVTGVVLGPDGRPMRANVACGNWSTPVRTTGDGWFRIGPFPEGPVTLVPYRSDLYSDAREEDEVTVPAGEEGVVLRYDPGWDLHLRIRNWRETEESVWARLTDEASGDHEKGLVWHDGTLRFGALKVDRSYTLYMRIEEQGLVLYMTALKLGVGELEVDLVPEERITGRLLLPPGGVPNAVSVVVAGEWMRGEVDRNGEFEIRGLPPGTWTVNGVAVVDGKWWRGTAAARSGDFVNVPLAPE